MIGEHEVHLFAVRIDQPSLAEEPCGFLSPEELATLAKIPRLETRRRWAVVRSATRILLARNLVLHPVDVRLDTGPNGKPRLAGNGRLRFNLSHSGDLLVLALTLDSEIGVDVEQLRVMPRAIPLARHFFLPDEAAVIERFHTDNLALTFFGCWTQKEAYLKANGLGIDGGLQRFRVAVDPSHPAEVTWIDGDDASRWQMHRWHPAPGYIAAVAYRDQQKTLVLSDVVDASTLLVAASLPVIAEFA